MSEPISFEEAARRVDELYSEYTASAERDGRPDPEIVRRLNEASAARDNHPDLPMLREWSRIVHEELDDLT